MSKSGIKILVFWKRNYFLAQMNGDTKKSDSMIVPKLGPILVSGSRDKTIKFFDINAGCCLFTLVSP